MKTEAVPRRAAGTQLLSSSLRLAILLLAANGIDAADARAENPAGEKFFENRIRPVLAGVCVRCHGPQKQSGGLRLDSREAIAKGGDSGAAIDAAHIDQSLLLEAVRREEGVSAMPPDEPLSKQQVADLTTWVSAGAPWPKQIPRIQARAHWAFQNVRDVVPPAVHDERWVQTSVDQFILARLEGLGRKPAKAADRRTLLRRVTFDLTGLPPSFDEIVAFERDPSPGALEDVVNRLLASPRYGEHWGRHWLDVVRYADTAGDTADIPVPEAWRYRNYVIDAFSADLPYDQFLREQIAGDVLAGARPREHYASGATATGFLAISRRFGFDSENYQHLTIQDTIDTLGQSVLGLGLGCARCHDHKFDPISMHDYYALFGIFDSSRYAFPGSEQKQQTRALVPLLPPDDSRIRWREFDALVAAVSGALERQKQPVPKAVLRSLHEIDGDFELQAAAAGGSTGVLVPPWLYEGTIAVTREAQSPFENLHARGKVGVSVPGGPGRYRIIQAIYPERTPETCSLLHVNLDFRVAAAASRSNGLHRFWIGAVPGSPAVEVLISADAVFHRSGATIDRIGSLRANEWHNLRLTLDLDNRTYSGSVQARDHATAFSGKPFSKHWPGRINLVALDSVAGTENERQPKVAVSFPGIEFDNLGIEERPIPARNRAAIGTGHPQAAALADAGRLASQLNKLLVSGPFPMAYGITEGTPHDVRIQMRGEPDQPGNLVRRGFIKALGGGALGADCKGSGRLELAQWLTRSDNPLVARVMVNRIWQYHFGQGLVRTPNDFGSRGAPPTHPELLDHLASRFIQSGWSLKAMHRLIILSATFQQASELGVAPGDRGDVSMSTSRKTSTSTSMDADLYSPFARRRLGAEEIRDSILAISGELDRRPARGHLFPSPVAWGFTQHAPFSAVYDHDKRSVYLMTQRIKRHPFLALFDGPDPNSSTAVRLTTTVPTQALYFLNDPFVHTKAERYAGRLSARRREPAELFVQAWRDVLGREPSGTERAEAAKFFEDYRAGLAEVNLERGDVLALAALVRTLFGSNEFIYLD